MKKHLKRLLFISLLGLSTLLTAGCAAVAVGAAAGGTVAYVRGDLEVTYDHSLERVFDAARAAMDDLGFATVSDRGDRTGGEIVARTARDRRVQIVLEPVADQVTKVRIRIGTFGDQDLSMRINEAIRERL
jgi:ABC-type sugar transport system substrate-binding protein